MTSYSVALNIQVDDESDRSRAFHILSGQAREMERGFPVVSVSAYKHDDIQGRIPGEEYFDEYTMFKVLNAIKEAGVPEDMANNAINAMQNAGILFRERA